MRVEKSNIDRFFQNEVCCSIYIIKRNEIKKGKMNYFTRYMTQGIIK